MTTGDEINTGGGGAVNGNVNPAGNFTGRDAPANTINFSAPESVVQQLVLVLTDLKLDMRDLSNNFGHMVRQQQDMRIDINALKIDMVAMKQQMDIRRNQSDTHGREIHELKTQVAKVSTDVISEVQSIRASLSRRSQIELWVLSGFLAILGALYVIGQMQW